mmetsp:Transcript_51341/g.109172  ORF Transcript_51341/g.109172 Transcript_51341/m.109172 type:complete len:399 (+) Transcript_51341:880-2076(+)
MIFLVCFGGCVTSCICGLVVVVAVVCRSHSLCCSGFWRVGWSFWIIRLGARGELHLLAGLSLDFAASLAASATQQVVASAPAGIVRRGVAGNVAPNMCVLVGFFIIIVGCNWSQRHPPHQATIRLPAQKPRGSIAPLLGLLQAPIGQQLHSRLRIHCLLLGASAATASFLSGPRSTWPILLLLLLLLLIVMHRQGQGPALQPQPQPQPVSSPGTTVITEAIVHQPGPSFRAIATIATKTYLCVLRLHGWAGGTRVVISIMITINSDAAASACPPAGGSPLLVSRTFIFSIIFDFLVPEDAALLVALATEVAGNVTEVLSQEVCSLLIWMFPGASIAIPAAPHQASKADRMAKLQQLGWQAWALLPQPLLSIQRNWGRRRWRQLQPRLRIIVTHQSRRA